MKTKFRLMAAAGLFMSVIVFMAGCGDNKEVVSDNPVSTQQEEVSEEPIQTEQTEVETFDVDELENSLTGISLSIQDQAHNIYKGNFGDEEVIVDIWTAAEDSKAYVSFIGSFHSDKLSFECELSEDGIRFHDDDYYLMLREQTDGNLSGYYYESGSKVAECELELSYINSSDDKDKLYTIGSNEEVEKFAEKMIDAVNSNDLETISKYIHYPITLKIDQLPQTIESQEDFLALDESQVFTEDFLAAMMDAYPEFMFSNGDDGVMAGESEFNIWINTDENGEFQIIAINN